MLTACQAQSQDEYTSSSEEVVVVQTFSYGHLPLQQLHKEASSIFVGRVAKISPTRWNQDSGEPWYDNQTGSGLQFHELEFEVLQPIIKTGSHRKYVTITVLGPSPLDDNLHLGESDSSHLQIGTEVLVFADETDLAWKDGTRPVLMLMGAPETTALIQGTDGLYHYPNEPGFSLETLSTMVQSVKVP